MADPLGHVRNGGKNFTWKLVWKESLCQSALLVSAKDLCQRKMSSIWEKSFYNVCIFIATPTVLILLAPDSGAGEQLSSSLAPPVLIISLFGLSFGVFQSFKCDSNAI